MDKKLYESQIAKDTAKRFRMLCEYTFGLQEDDGEDMMPPQEEEMGAQEQPQGQPQEDENMPNMNGDMGGDMGGNMEGGAPGFNPEQEGDMNMDPNMMGGEMGSEQIQPEDEVIDVDELTNSQEETEEKVDDIKISMEKGFDKLINVIDKLNTMIDTSTANIENLKQELEKRNPTPLEKLNMRAANDSYPFSVSPEAYWKEKEATSNYRIGGEDEPDSEQYIITQGDIDKITDYRKISQDLNNSSLNQNLMNIFGLK